MGSKSKHLLKHISNNYSDDFQTPPNAILPLLPYLKKEWVIWECACGKGNLVNKLQSEGYKVVGTDIDTVDFLKDTPSFNYDCILTNPPYSIKNEFIERCYSLDIPFALLLPLTALETETRQKQWKKGVQLILFNKRINFEPPFSVKRSKAWFSTAWFCYKLNLPAQLNFVNLTIGE